jgi:hypothetical protein
MKTLTSKILTSRFTRLSSVQGAASTVGLVSTVPAINVAGCNSDYFGRWPSGADLDSVTVYKYSVRKHGQELSPPHVLRNSDEVHC